MKITPAIICLFGLFARAEAAEKAAGKLKLTLGSSTAPVNYASTRVIESTMTVGDGKVETRTEVSQEHVLRFIKTTASGHLFQYTGGKVKASIEAQGVKEEIESGESFDPDDAGALKLALYSVVENNIVVDGRTFEFELTKDNKVKGVKEVTADKGSAPASEKKDDEARIAKVGKVIESVKIDLEEWFVALPRQPRAPKDAWSGSSSNEIEGLKVDAKYDFRLTEIGPSAFNVSLSGKGAYDPSKLKDLKGAENEASNALRSRLRLVKLNQLTIQGQASYSLKDSLLDSLVSDTRQKYQMASTDDSGKTFPVEVKTKLELRRKASKLP